MKHFTKRVRDPRKRGIYWTLSERTDKKYTVGDAVRAAQVLLNTQLERIPKVGLEGFMNGFCLIRLECLNGVWLNEKITLVDLNFIATHLANETIAFYYPSSTPSDSQSTEEG